MTQGPTSKPRAGRHRRECGVTLVEILISILLMSFGLLAMGAMQAWSVAGARASGNRIAAALLATEAADLLRANPAAFAADGDDSETYSPDAAAPTADSLAGRCAFPACTPATLAQRDLAALKARVRAELPQGGLQISRSTSAGTAGTRQADLWLMWFEPRLFTHEGAGGQGGSAEQAFDNCPPAAQDLAQMPRCFYMRVVF